MKKIFVILLSLFVGFGLFAKDLKDYSYLGNEFNLEIYSYAWHSSHELYSFKMKDFKDSFLDDLEPSEKASFNDDFIVMSFLQCLEIGVKEEGGTFKWSIMSEDDDLLISVENALLSYDIVELNFQESTEGNKGDLLCCWFFETENNLYCASLYY